jgi:carbamoyl-phosphate synthase large subunit
MNILITSAGQRVSLVRAFQDELKVNHPRSKVLAVDLNPWLSPACQVADECFDVPRVTDPCYIERLLQICVNNDVGMVVPTIDTELDILAKHHCQFKREDIHVIISSHDFISICRDKRKTAVFFENIGIKTPRLFSKDKLEFPLFIKPYDGSLSADTHYVASLDAITTQHLNNDRFLYMEYIDREKYDEYTVDMYYDRNHILKCLVPRKRIHVRAGEVNKAVTAKNVIVNFLKERMGKVQGAVGCLTLQLFYAEDAESIVGIEINARFGGGYPLSYFAGGNYPGWLIQEYFEDKTIPYFEGWEDELLMLRYDKEVLVHGNKG